MLPQQYCLRWKYHHSNLQTMFSQLLDRGCFCDVTLACEGQLIRAHRVVLCACSTFFDTVLTNYASERDPIIIMKDVTFADVKSLIEFMYKGEINVEHANLATLLKTADDLKIKGLAEVSWRDDDEAINGGAAVPAASHDAEYVIHSPHNQRHMAHDQIRISPEVRAPRHAAVSPTPPHSHSHAQAARMPLLTPMPSPSITIAASPADYYLGPKRKRGRPPLDDAYDVFNVRKMSQYAGHMDAPSFHESSRPAHVTVATQPPHEEPRRHAPSTTSAYQQHIHQQQRRQRQKQELLQQQQNAAADSGDEADETQTDPEWITSNLEVHVAECEATAMTQLEHSDDSQAAAAHSSERKTTSVAPTSEYNEKKQSTPTPPPSSESKSVASNEKNSPKSERFKKRSLLEKAKEHRQRDAKQKGNHNDDASASTDATAQHSKDELVEHEEQEENEESSQVDRPTPVEEIESVQQVLQQQQQTVAAAVAATTTASSSTSTTNSTSSSADMPSTSTAPPQHTVQEKRNAAAAVAQMHAAHVHAQQQMPHYAKYTPAEVGAGVGGGYMLNEHGMLMTHDFPAHAAAALAAANGSVGEHEFVDIKMEDYDAAELRLTSEEMSQWQDVIKMDDYLAKGRRPQFWEEPFTRRVLDAIKNKRLEMKKAARILGVSYGTLYGRYREVYGCLKHPYSSPMRPSQSSQLAPVQPRFDIAWPSQKRDSSLLQTPHEMGKIRPKDLSELWARPQI